MAQIIDIAQVRRQREVEANRPKLPEDYPDDVMDVIQAIIEEENDPAVVTQRLAEIAAEQDKKK